MKKLFVSIALVALAAMNLVYAQQGSRYFTLSNQGRKLCMPTDNPIMGLAAEDVPESIWVREEDGDKIHIKNTLTGRYLAIMDSEAGPYGGELIDKSESTKWIIVEANGKVRLLHSERQMYLGLSVRNNDFIAAVKKYSDETTAWTMTFVSRNQTWLKDKPAARARLRAPNVQWVTIKAKNSERYLSSVGRSEFGSEAKFFYKAGITSKWIVIKQDGGYCRLQNAYNGLYLANFGSKENNAVLKQTNNPGQGALWRFESSGVGVYIIQNKLSGKYIGIRHPNTARQIPNGIYAKFRIKSNKDVGALVQEDPGQPQKTEQSQETWIELKSVETKTYMSTTEGGNTNITLNGNSNNNSKWAIVPKVDGYVQLRNLATGKFLANFGSMTNGTELKQTDNPGQGALWKLEKENYNRCRLKNKKSGLYAAYFARKGLVVQSSSRLVSRWSVTSNKEFEALFKDSPTSTQPNPTNTSNTPTNTESKLSGWIELKNKCNSGYLSSVGQKDNGSLVKVVNISSDISKWQLIDKGDGYYQFRNKQSNLYLANFGSKVDGAKLKQTNNPGTGALWKMTEVNGLLMFQNKVSGLYLAAKDGQAIQSSKTNHIMCKWFTKN